jgi:hypothetical protein
VALRRTEAHDSELETRRGALASGRGRRGRRGRLKTMIGARIRVRSSKGTLHDFKPAVAIITWLGALRFPSRVTVLAQQLAGHDQPEAQSEAP